MRVKLQGWRRTIELVPWEEDDGDDEAVGLFALADPGVTLVELRSIVAELPGAGTSLRAVLTAIEGTIAIAEFDDVELCARVMAAVERGRLRVRVEPYTPMTSEPFRPRELPEYDDHVLGQLGVDDHWVEIELLDDEDQPIVGEPCRIVLPDAREVFSKTDQNGLVRVEHTVAGQCLVYFPQLDDDAVAPLVAFDDWVGVELVDEEDHPVVGERCRIVLPDGSEVTSRTDRDGVVRIERCVAGECEIYFPDLDKDVVAPLA